MRADFKLVTSFLRRSSTISQSEVLGETPDQQDVEDEIDFPRLLLCSDSMHSKEKMKKYFPMMQLADVKLLYGENNGERNLDWVIIIIII